VQTLAQSSQDSDIHANDCPGLARACSAAAKELKAARDLIAGYEAQIAAADARLDLAKKEIESLKQLSALESDRAGKLEEVIAAEREAKAALVKLKDEQAERIATLEKKLSRSRKATLIAAGVAAITILIGVVVRR
jgi:multidrug resistance efflux pump